MLKIKIAMNITPKEFILTKIYKSFLIVIMKEMIKMMTQVQL